MSINPSKKSVLILLIFYYCGSIFDPPNRQNFTPRFIGSEGLFSLHIEAVGQSLQAVDVALDIIDSSNFWKILMPVNLASLDWQSALDYLCDTYKKYNPLVIISNKNDIDIKFDDGIDMRNVREYEHQQYIPSRLQRSKKFNEQEL